MTTSPGARDLPQSVPPNPKKMGATEFVFLMALLTSLVALSIDAMLPALPAIGMDLGTSDSNHNQLVLSVFFLGLAIGQIIYGPLSDASGRKPAIYAGLLVFVVGCVLSSTANSFLMMLIGRFLQGFGAAGPRIVTVSMVRDMYSGDRMARVMSFVMTVFIMVPIAAPALGQAILLLAGWRSIFLLFFALGVLACAWLAFRQPETLPPERRLPLSLRQTLIGVKETCANRAAFGYTLVAGLVFGAFLGYLLSAQQIFQDVYGLGELFPLYFAVLALALGVASYANGRLVLRLGMRTLSQRALYTLLALSAIFLPVCLIYNGQPALSVFMAWCVPVFFCLGVLFANVNALAMEPMGHIAGVAAAVVGCITTLISLSLGTLIGQSFDGSVTPLAGAFFLLATAALMVMRWSQRT